MSQYIRNGKQILQTTEDQQHLMVFTSVNQAKLYNRTKLGGVAIKGTFKVAQNHTSEVIKHVAK